MCRSKRAVALKIMAHDADRRELHILERISGGSEHITQLLDHFELAGPNGTHLCLVLEVMWQNVLGFLEGYSNEPALVPLVKKISKQVIQGLQYLQTMGIIHNGITHFSNLILDVHPRNFLVSFRSTPLTLSELLAGDHSVSIYGTESANAYFEWSPGPEYEKVRIYTSHPICRFLDGEAFALDDIVIKIADFGKGSQNYI